MSDAPLRVAVVGRDADLWLTVSVLSRALAASGVQVMAVELPSGLSQGHVSATLPPIEALHGNLKLDEATLLRTTQGSFSLGQNFVAPKRPSFFHAWGAYGAPIEGNAFYPCWLRAVRSGLRIPLQGFCPTAIAATNGRMLLPDEATVAFGRTDYGYHLNTIPYLALLKTCAASAGVAMHRAARVAVRRRADGGIAAVLLDDSQTIEADLFIDASQESAVLIGEALEVPRISWQRHFLVDRRLSGRAPPFTTTPPFAEIRMGSLGFSLLHPTQSATGVSFCYAHDQLADEAALALAATASGSALQEIQVRSVKPGLQSRFWDRNCIAVGGAACTLDPIHDVELHLLQTGVVHLLALFPVSAHFESERIEYNRLMQSHYERIRDFQCAFYHCAPFEGSFWERRHAVAVPGELKHRIATFRARALVAPMEDESFSQDSWSALLSGLGLEPEAWPPAIDSISPQRLSEECGRLLQFVKAKVLEQPMHGAYLAKLCPAAA